jgi:hypothetical protein
MDFAGVGVVLGPAALGAPAAGGELATKLATAPTTSLRC